MKPFKLAGVAAAGAVLTASCATTPPITVNYYLAQGAMELTVIRTVACDDANNPIIATSVVAKMVYSRDPAKAYPLTVKRLDSGLANTQVDVVLTEDGRLSSLNSTQTGQGGEIVKSAISLVTAGIGTQAVSPDNAAACKFIKDVAKDKPITLTFRYGDDFTENSNGPLYRDHWTTIVPVPESRHYYGKVDTLIGRVCVRTKRVAKPAVRALGDLKSRNMVYLTLREPGLALVEVSQDCAEPFWEATLPVPQLGEDFDLPIPRAAVFGRQTIVLAFSDSGAITTLKIGKDSGAASALGAATELVNRVVVTDAEAAARAKAEADVIAQQQRLVRCQTNPTACT